MTKGTYVRDFYFVPTVICHDGDLYKSIELAWLKWYVGIAWATRKEEEE